MSVSPRTASWVRLPHVCLSLFFLLGLSACQPTDTNSAGEPPLPTRVVATATATAAHDTWQTYQSEPGGFTADYPADWTVKEEIRKDGAVITTFSSDGGGASITVIAQTPLPRQAEPPVPVDIPNTRCEEVSVDRLPGIRCFDTIAFSTTTTFGNEIKSYTVIASGKRTDPAVYQRFLDVLRVLAYAP